MASSKPIQEQIYKSRLTITYRTNITGTLQQEKVPFRVLVLGEFAGRSLPTAHMGGELAQRSVRTIKRGTSVAEHLAALVPVFRIPDELRQLRSSIPGSITVSELTCAVPRGLQEGDKKALALDGWVKFSSETKENGYCDFEDYFLAARGEVDVSKSEGQVVFGDARIRVYGKAIGDHLDPATRKPAGKIVGLALGEEKQSFKLDAKDKAEIVDDDDGSGEVPKQVRYKIGATAAGGGKPQAWPIELERAVPVTSMGSFAPDAIAASIPEVQRTQLLKHLLSYLSSSLRNRPELRAQIKDLLPGPADKTPAARTAKIESLGKLKAWVDQNLSILRLDVPSAASTTSTPADADVTGLQDKIVLKLGATSTDLYAKDEAGKATSKPLGLVDWLGASPTLLKFDDRNVDISQGAWLMNALAVFLANTDEAAAEVRKIDGRKPDKDSALKDCLGSYTQFLGAISALVQVIDRRIQRYLDAVYHDDDFKLLEANWRGLDQIEGSVEDDDVYVDFLDVSKEDLRNDLIDHDSDIFSGALFDKVYVAEYDRYGGKPYASMIGLYEFDSSQDDVAMLRAMGRVANASHCPFISAASPAFFFPGDRTAGAAQVADIGDLDAVLGQPSFGKWQELRDTDYAAYLGLTLPRYLVRAPWGHVESNGNAVHYTERLQSWVPGGDLLWGNAAVLFAQNMIRSYQESGWAQHIRGPVGGGLCEGLVSYKYTRNSHEEIQPPVEMAIPDYRELQFANNGFIPLVHKKGEAVATFFSAQSVKKAKKFVEDLSTKNSALVTNLAYTFSITRIAHFVKRMMREYIGAAADDAYIQQVLSSWLGQYVTLITNPDDLTLRAFPFKAATVEVEKKPGPLGWYKATIKILPHVQFEGMDVELRLEAALGGP